MFTLTMEGLLTVGVIAVLFVGVHLAFAIYLYRSLSTGQDSPSADGLKSGIETTVGDNSRPSNSHEDRQTVPCPTCGASNDPSFQFCRRCVTHLSDRSRNPDSVQPSSG